MAKPPGRQLGGEHHHAVYPAVFQHVLGNHLPGHPDPGAGRQKRLRHPGGGPVGDDLFPAVSGLRVHFVRYGENLQTPQRPGLPQPYPHLRGEHQAVLHGDLGAGAGPVLQRGFRGVPHLPHLLGQHRVQCPAARLYVPGVGAHVRYHGADCECEALRHPDDCRLYAGQRGRLHGAPVHRHREFWRFGMRVSPPVQKGGRAVYPGEPAGYFHGAQGIGGVFCVPYRLYGVWRGQHPGAGPGGPHQDPLQYLLLGRDHLQHRQKRHEPHLRQPVSPHDAQPEF